MPAFLLLSLFASVAWPIALAQTAAPSAPSRAAIIGAAKAMMTKARYCALVTVGADGRPQAREVDAFSPDPDMTVWIATNPVTRKVKEIRRDPRVTLYYAVEGGAGYVTILGRAEVVEDAAEKAKRWKEDWASYYSDKNRGSDYVLIRIRPHRLEIVSYTHKLLNDPKTWQPISIDFAGEETVTRGTGTFEVRLTPQGGGDTAEGTSLGRVAIDKTFHGVIEGTSRGEMLTALTPIKDSAGYVAIERVSGAVAGRKGTFILQHNGTMARGTQQLTISVVPDSGTGELTGIAGTMTIQIADGKHSYGFEYSLP